MFARLKAKVKQPVAEAAEKAQDANGIAKAAAASTPSAATLQQPASADLQAASQRSFAAAGAAPPAAAPQQTSSNASPVLAMPPSASTTTAAGTPLPSGPSISASTTKPTPITPTPSNVNAGAAAGATPGPTTRAGASALLNDAASALAATLESSPAANGGAPASAAPSTTSPPGASAPSQVLAAAQGQVEKTAASVAQTATTAANGVATAAQNAATTASNAVQATAASAASAIDAAAASARSTVTPAATPVSSPPPPAAGSAPSTSSATSPPPPAAAASVTAAAGSALAALTSAGSKLAGSVTSPASATRSGTATSEVEPATPLPASSPAGAAAPAASAASPSVTATPPAKLPAPPATIAASANATPTAAEVAAGASPATDSAVKTPATPTKPGAAATPAAADGGKPAAAAPPVAAVLKEAMSEIATSGKETVTSVGGVLDALKKKKPINVTLDQVVQALFFLFLGFQLLLIKLLRPSPWWLLWYSLVGFGVGLGLSFLFYYNRKKKAESCEVLGLNVGLKGLHYLAGGLPSWLNVTEREKVKWLNSLIEEVWPYYDKGVCKMVKNITEGIFEQTLKTMKVPGIKRIGFKQLTFGNAPFAVESIYVSDKHQDALVVEVDVRWSGDANITLAIELSAGEFSKMCPRVTDITFVGSLRVTLKPLVDQIPGFGAMVVTFRKPPMVKYRLDFGKALGGQYAAGVVKPFINHVINNVIVNMFVWPQRLVIPVINTEEMQVELAKLQYRTQGVLKVTVAQASNLRKTDVIGSSDPFAELSTDGKYTATTKCIKNTLSPKWEETFWMLVQEPHSQEMKVEVYDRDFFSAKELLTLNLGSTFGAKELLGRALVKLAPITAQEPEPVTKWYHLGEGEFSNPEGCGKGAGRIQLTCVYRSITTFKPDEIMTATRGILVVRVVRANKLPRGAGGRTQRMTAYVRVKCGEEERETPPVTSAAEHVFNSRNVFEFYNVKFSADIKFKVMEKTAIADDEVGEFDLGVSDVAGANDLNPLSGKNDHGLLLRDFPMDSTGGASLVVSLRFCPYF